MQGPLSEVVQTQPVHVIEADRKIMLPAAAAWRTTCNLNILHTVNYIRYSVQQGVSQSCMLLHKFKCTAHSYLGAGTRPLYEQLPC